MQSCTRYVVVLFSTAELHLTLFSQLLCRFPLETSYTLSLKDMVEKLHQYQRLVVGSLLVVTCEHQV